MSGVTNNPMESLNAVFKRWLAWKELSLDSLAQMFYLVNGFYVNEIKRGFCGVGKCNFFHFFFIFNFQYVFYMFFIGGYHLRQDYIDSRTDASFLSLITSFSPDEAVNRMKEILLKKQTSLLETNDTRVVSDEQASLSISIDLMPDLFWVLCFWLFLLLSLVIDFGLLLILVLLFNFLNDFFLEEYSFP